MSCENCKRLCDCIEKILREVDFEFGGWGEEGLLAEEEPEHYVIKARELVAEINALDDAVNEVNPANPLVKGE